MPFSRKDKNMSFRNRLKAKLYEGYMLKELFSQKHYNLIQPLFIHILAVISGKNISELLGNIDLLHFFANYSRERFGVDEEGKTDFDPQKHEELNPENKSEMIQFFIDVLLSAQNEGFLSPYIDINWEDVEREFYKARTVPYINRIFTV